MRHAIAKEKMICFPWRRRIGIHSSLLVSFLRLRLAGSHLSFYSRPLKRCFNVMANLQQTFWILQVPYLEYGAGAIWRTFSVTSFIPTGV